MFFRIFRSFRVLTLFLIVLTGALLWVQTYLRVYVHGFVPSPPGQMPFYLELERIVDGIPKFSIGLTFSLLVLISFFLVRIGTKYILTDRTYFHSLFFLLLAGSYFPIQRFNAAVIGIPFLVLAIDRVLGAYAKDKVTYNYFDAAILISVGSFFYPNLIFYILMLWIALIIFRPISWRSWVQTIIGIAVPYVFVDFCFYYFKGEYFYLSHSLLKAIVQRFAFSIPTFQYILFYGFIVFLLIVASIQISLVFQRKKILVRNSYILFLWIFVITILIGFFSPSASYDLFLILAIPMTFLLAHYFMQIRAVFWGELLTLTMLSLLGYIQYVQYYGL